jgi:hypothetical protein
MRDNSALPQKQQTHSAWGAALEEVGTRNLFEGR